MAMRRPARRQLGLLSEARVRRSRTGTRSHAPDKAEALASPGRVPKPRRSYSSFGTRPRDVHDCSSSSQAGTRSAATMATARRSKAGTAALLTALSASLRRASQMLARSLEQVFAWRRVAGSVRRLRGSGGERRRFGTGAHREVRVARGGGTPPRAIGHKWAQDGTSGLDRTGSTSR